MGAGSAFKNDKNRPSCTYPLGSYMHELGWKKSIFFYENVAFFRFERISRAPRRVPRPPLPSEHALKKSTG